MPDLADDRSPDERAIGSALVTSVPVRISPPFDEAGVMRLVRIRVAAHLPGAVSAPVTRTGRHVARLGVATVAVIVAVLLPIVLVGSMLWPAAADRPVVQTIAMSWAYSFVSVAQIGAASNLVIVGTVERATGEEYIASGYPSTTFAVHVDRTLKGEPSADVTVIQDGGRQGVNTSVELEEFPLMASGDHVLLFLRPIVLHGTTVWAIVGGPEGRLIVDGQSVTTTQTAFVLKIPADLTVDQVATMVYDQ